MGKMEELVGWLDEWLVGWLDEWLVGWLVGWLARHSTNNGMHRLHCFDICAHARCSSRAKAVKSQVTHSHPHLTGIGIFVRHRP